MLKIMMKSLLSQKLRLIPIIIQFIIGLTAVFVCSSFIDVQNTAQKRMTAIFPDDAIHIYADQVDRSTHDSDNKSGSPRHYFAEMIGNETADSTISKIGMVQQISLIDEATDTRSLGMMINDSFAQISGLKGVYSELLEHWDKNGDYVPAIAGYGYKDTFQLNEEYFFNYYPEDKKMPLKIHIVAIQNENEHMLLGNSSLAVDTVTDEQNYLIIPQICDFDNIAYSYNMFLPAEENWERDYSVIADTFAKEGVSMNARRITEEVDQVMNRQKPFLIATALFSVVILILSSVGCIGTVLSGMSLRKKEFGVRYALGMQKKQLVYMIVSEMMVIFIISGLVAIAVSNLLMIGPFAEMKTGVSKNALFIGFLVILTCSLICSIIPVNALLQFDPIILLNNSRGTMRK